MSTFIIPMMFLQCLTLEPTNGETIRGFSFEQPVSIVVEDGKSVYVENSTFIVSYGCTSLVANNSARIDYYGNIFATVSGNVRGGQ